MQQHSQGNPGPVSKGWPVAAGQVNALSSYTAKTAVGVVGFLACAGFPFLGISFVPAGTVSGGGNIAIETSSDGGASWNTPTAIQFATAGGVPGAINSAGFAMATAGAQIYLVALPGTTHVRVRLTAVMTGAGSMSVQMGACATGVPSNIYVTGFGNTINSNLLSVGSSFAGISTITQAVQASQTSGIVNAAATARTTTTGWAVYKSVDFLLNITGAGVATGVLQLYIQDSVDGGVSWDDVVSFNTFTFGAALATQRACVQGAIATTRAGTAAQQIQALAAGTIRQGPFGDRFKVVEAISGVSGSPTGVTYRIDAIGHL